MPLPLTSRLPLPCLLLFAGMALSACGSDAIPPEDDPLTGIDELAIHAVISDRVGIFRHSAGASGNVRLALGADGPPAAPLSSALHGHTLRYDDVSDEWVAEPDGDVPTNGTRIVWYDTIDSAVATPLTERGHVDLIDQGDPALEAVRLRAVRLADPAGEVADYVMRFGESTTSTTRTYRFDATGMVNDGSDQLQLDRQEETVEQTGSGDTRTVLRIDLSGTGFAYRTDLEETVTASSQTSRVVLATSVTIDGVSTQVELDLEGPAPPTAGTGLLRHAGRTIAHLVTADSEMTFTRPDGGEFSSNQQRRLGTLVTVLLSPLPVVEAYVP